MTVCTSLIAAIITVETALTDGTKTVETAEVPETDGIVRFVWPKEKVPRNFKSVTVTPDFAMARKGESVLTVQWCKPFDIITNRGA